MHGDAPAVKPDINATQEAEAKAAAAAVWRYPSTNCYDGRGGRQIGRLAVHGDARSCEGACRSTAGCACCVTDDINCYLNAFCNLRQCDCVGNCDHEGCGRLSAFTTWVLA
uniref:Uncharacterized protein n=1 Tax=Alexandrium monilatum TaxID=311494 RepID=A0A6T1KC16_9DINO